MSQFRDKRHDHCSFLFKIQGPHVRPGALPPAEVIYLKVSQAVSHQESVLRFRTMHVYRFGIVATKEEIHDLVFIYYYVQPIQSLFFLFDCRSRLQTESNDSRRQESQVDYLGHRYSIIALLILSYL